jgi:hypothetical protein
MAAGAPPAAKDAVTDLMKGLKGQFKDAKGFGEGAADTDDPTPSADPDLDDEIGGDPEPEGGEPEGGELEVDPGETSEGKAALDGDGKTVDAAEKALAAEDALLLEGEKIIKQGKGSFISQASFLKRLKRETAKVKEIEAKFKPFVDKASEYEHWDKFAKNYREASAFVEKIRPLYASDPWLAQIITDRMEGRPVDWAKMTNVLKPFLAPFWDGVADPVAADPAVAAMQRAEAVERQLAEMKQGQLTQQQKQQEQQLSQQTQERYRTAYSSSEKAVWEKWKGYKTDFYRNLLFDRAAVIQEQLPPDRIVDLTKVAAEIFGEFEKQKTASSLAAQKARERTRRAAGEGGGGLPGSTLPPEPAPAKPLSIRDQVKKRIMSVAGAKFDD